LNKFQGDIAEQAAILYFSSVGGLCSRPITHSKYYDLIVDDGNKLIKVEVKSSRNLKKSGSYEFSLVTNGGNKTGSIESKRIDSSRTDKVFLYSLCGCIWIYESSILCGRAYVNGVVGDENYIGRINIEL